MTNQVNNVTENGSAVNSDIDAYDAAWDEEDDLDQTSDSSEQIKAIVGDSTPAIDQENASMDDPESDVTVADESNSDTPATEEEAPSGEHDPSDIWADANDAQRAELVKLQNDLKSMSGRTASERNAKAALEKELQTTKSELREFTRTKGLYETEHPELFQEVTTYLEEAGVTQPNADMSGGGTDVNDDDIKTVFRVHPDAHDLMQTDEWSAFVGDLPSDLQAKYGSDDPFDFIEVLTEFKVSSRSAKPKAQPKPKPKAVPNARLGGNGSRPSATQHLSDQQGYDAEWDMVD